jgi:hypothetical protein
MTDQAVLLLRKQLKGARERETRRDATVTTTTTARAVDLVDDAACR